MLASSRAASSRTAQNSGSRAREVACPDRFTERLERPAKIAST